MVFLEIITWGLCNIGYQNSSPHQISWITFIHNIHFGRSIILIFFPEHGRMTAVLCQKCQNKWLSKNRLWENEISRDLDLRWVSCGSRILYIPSHDMIFVFPDIEQSRINAVVEIWNSYRRELSCWSLRCSWTIACRRCSNYIFILNLTPGFNGLGKVNYKMRREAFKFRYLVRLILETLRYWNHCCLDQLAVILQTAYSNTVPWAKLILYWFEFSLKFVV